MSLPIVKHPRALEDVAAIYALLADTDVSLAERFLAAVDADLGRIAAMPTVDVLRRFKHPKLIGIRSRGVTGFRKYLIFYRSTDDAVQFLRLIHGARDLERVLAG